MRISLRTAGGRLVACLLIPQIAAAADLPVLFDSDFETYQLGQPQTVLLRDVDADGTLDMVVSDAFGSVRVLIGTGAAHFSEPMQISLVGVGDVAYGDLSGDGIGDLLATTTMGSIYRFRGVGDGSFQAAEALLPTSSPAGLAIGRINNDGRNDFVVASSGTHQVLVYIAITDDLLLPLTTMYTGLEPRGVAIAELNGDMNPDIVTINRVSNTVTVFHGNGDGTFAAAVHHETIAQPTHLTVTDVDGDLDADLVVLSKYADAATVHLSNSDGTFAPRFEFPTPLEPEAVAAADFTGNANVDLAIACSSGRVALHAGIGGGHFGAPIEIPSQAPTSLAAADLDGDGKADLVVAEPGDPALRVSLGNGNGAFSRGLVEVSVDGGGLKQIEPMFLDADSNIDLAVTNLANDTVSLLLGDGTGQFTKSGELLAANPSGLDAGDFNGDQIDDLVVARGTGMDVFLGIGGGSFAAGAPIDVGVGTADRFWRVRVTDLNHDSALDLVSVGGHNQAAIALGNGDGTFESVTNVVALPWQLPNSVDFGDFNEDGDVDLLVAGQWCCPGAYSVLAGNGDGTFAPFQAFETPSPPATRPYHAMAADLDDDGHDDIVTLANALLTRRGNGDLTFAGDVLMDAGDEPVALDVADFDGDALLDVVVADPDLWALSVYLGLGDGAFGARLGYGLPFRPNAVRAADVDADGDVDIVTSGDNTDNVAVLLNRSSQPTSVSPGPGAAAVPFVLSASSTDSDGSSRIRYEVLRPAIIRVALYDVRGRIVHVLRDGQHTPGFHELLWSGEARGGSSAARGVYFLELRSNGQRATGKVVRLVR